MDDWVRALAFRLPSRKPAQLAQLQFHWGKPPPAADPRIWTNMEAPNIQQLKIKTPRRTEALNRMFYLAAGLNGWRSTW
jgi:hypothetical protein